MIAVFAAILCIDFKVALVTWLMDILCNFVMTWYAHFEPFVSFISSLLSFSYIDHCDMLSAACFYDKGGLHSHFQKSAGRMELKTRPGNQGINWERGVDKCSSPLRHRFFSAPSMQTISSTKCTKMPQVVRRLNTSQAQRIQRIVRKSCSQSRVVTICHLAVEMPRWSRRIYSERSTWCQRQRPEQECRCKSRQQSWPHMPTKTQHIPMAAICFDHHFPSRNKQVIPSPIVKLFHKARSWFILFVIFVSHHLPSSMDKAALRGTKRLFRCQWMKTPAKTATILDFGEWNLDHLGKIMGEKKNDCLERLPEGSRYFLVD